MENTGQKSNEVDQLIRNAQLREELEPFLDESVFVVDTDKMSTEMENEFIESLLAWESAPVLPIANWFNPPLQLTPPNQLDEDELSAKLAFAIDSLASKNIALECTEHLSDNDLYRLIIREILPSKEKMVESQGSQITWQCIDQERDEEDWLQYYATDLERAAWESENPGRELPAMKTAPFQRNLPS